MHNLFHSLVNKCHVLTDMSSHPASCGKNFTGSMIARMLAAIMPDIAPFCITQWSNLTFKTPTVETKVFKSPITSRGRLPHRPHFSRLVPFSVVVTLNPG